MRRNEPNAPAPHDDAVTDEREWATRWFQPGRRDVALATLSAAKKETGGRLSEAERDFRGIQLVGQDLSGLDLSGADLSLANLSQSDLSGSRLAGVRLSGANLYGANLSECEFLGADLREADLSESTACRAGFGKADLSEANLFNANFSDATFTQASLRGTDARAATLTQARLRDSDLTNADFTRAVMNGVDLGGSRVSGTSFSEVDLREARFSGIEGHDAANWIGADIGNVDFCGAYLVRRTIEDQNYLHEFRTQSTASHLLYWVWWVTSDCGRSFFRWGLWTVLIVALFAGLYETVEVDYGDYRTSISSFYYSVVTLTTLGYGDVLPASTMAQVVAICQVTIGYVMLGGLLSIFSNKMSRRAS